MLVNLLLEIRGNLIVAGGLRCWLTYYYLLLISNSTLTSIVKLQLRLIIIIVLGFLCCVLEIKRYIF
jgi:hypothetical protein